MTPGHVRHTAMFIWKDDVDDAAKERAFAEVERLGGEPGVERLTLGTNVGTLKTDYDWILDLQLPDTDAAETLRSGDSYRETMRALAASTKYEWTARITHQMHGH